MSAQKKRAKREKTNTRPLLPAAWIAPCGMNCRLCFAWQRSRNPCPGCRGEDRGKCQTRVACVIKLCPARRGDFCTGCASFPCARLARLDLRYRTKYGMSMIENLRGVQTNGLRNFVKSEQAKWACPSCGEMLCVHQAACPACGHLWRPAS